MKRNFGPSDQDQERWDKRKAGRGGFDGRLAKLGLKPSVPGGVVHTGTVSKCAVRLERTSSTTPCRWRLEVSNPRLPVDIAITSENRLDLLAKVFAGQDVIVGDDAFDRAANLKGPEDMLLALLDHATRERLTLWLERGATIRRRTLELDTETAQLEPASILNFVRTASELMNSLSLPDGDVGPRIVRNAMSDAHPDVRLRNLEIAIVRYSSSVDDHVPALLKDNDPRIRVAAARYAPRLGRPVLIQLLLGPGDDARDSEILFHLLSRPAQPDLLKALERCLDRGGKAQQKAGHGLGELLRIYPELVPALQVKTCELMLEFGGSALRVPLLQQLADRGTRGELPAVVELARGWLTPREVKEAAQAAVRAILERSGGVVEGALSLSATPEDGSLALTGEAGGLAITNEDD